jgi:hypothetical protein
MLLLRLVNEIRYDPAAGAAHAHILSLHKQIELQVSGQPPAAYAGKCDQPDVKMEQLRYIGPPCSTLTCAHETCELARSHHALISPRPAICGAQLYAEDGQAKITCEACGAVYDVARPSP